MFGNQNKSSYEKATTLIGEGAVLESALFKSNGTIRIDGTYIGKINVNGDLVLDSKGVIEGNVDAHHALIAGKITGDIICNQEIHLSSTANVIGNIFCENLIVDEGAIFNGTSTMNSSNGKPPKKGNENNETIEKQ